MVSSHRPSLSIVIPARNEEKYLPACLDAIDAACIAIENRPEIIVVLNRCTDGTEEIARTRECIIVRDDEKNLSHIRNTGIRAAKGEWIVTIDADSRMSKSMLADIASALSQRTIIGGGVLILPERWSLGILLTGLCLVPIVIRYGISGGLFFFRKSDFEDISGFNEDLVSVEDIDFARRLKQHGRRNKRRFVTLYRSHILTSCRKFDRLGDWYFLKRPLLFMSLLKGRNQAAADDYWYEFER